MSQQLTKPGKHPHWPHVPLKGHANGKWYTVKRKRFYYFGQWADPDGAADQYRAVSELVSQGLPLLVAATPANRMTLDELIDRFLVFQESRVAEGEIDAEQFDAYRFALLGTVKDEQNPTKCIPKKDRRRARKPGFIDVIGGNAIVDLITSDQLNRYREKVRARLNGHSVNHHFAWVKALFRWAVETAKLTTAPHHRDHALRKVSKKELRREQRLREKRDGKPVFLRWECRLLLETAKRGSALRAAILLALNCGFTQKDLGELLLSDLDLERGHVNYTRVKTEILRQATLWPETVEAIREYLANRIEPADKTDADVLFVTRWRRRFWYRVVKRRRDGSIGRTCKVDSFRLQFDKHQRKLGLSRRGRGFRALRRTFASFADVKRDGNVKRRIMGHELEGMDPHYVRLMPRRRLQRITDYVRHKVLIVKLKPRTGTDTSAATTTPVAAGQPVPAAAA